MKRNGRKTFLVVAFMIIYIIEAVVKIAPDEMLFAPLYVLHKLGARMITREGTSMYSDRTF